VRVDVEGHPHEEAVTTRLPAVELTDNRRQQLPWEQAALDELRHGDPDTALATYQAHGRIHTAATAQQLRDRLVADWWTTAKDDLPGSIMIGLRRSDVAHLNHRARATMLTAGRLTGPTLVVGGGVELQAGDRIVCLRNDRQLGVVNGTRATITRIEPTARTVEAVDDRGWPLTLPGGLPRRRPRDPRLRHHRPQSPRALVDHTYTLVTETLYREWGYVTMSRGRHTNQLYHGPTAGDEPLEHHIHHDEDVADLTRQLRRSRAEQPITPEVAQIASTWRATLGYLASTTVQQQPQAHAERRRIAQEQAAVARRIEDLQGQQARTVGPAIRRRTRTQRAALAAELERQRDRLARLDRTLDQLDDRLARLPTSQQIATAQTQLHDLDAQLRPDSRIRAAHLAADPPPYLLAALGPPPTDRQQQAQWYRAVEDIEHHHLRWGITDPVRALGSGNRDQVHQLEHRRLQRILKTDGATPDRQIVQRTRGRAR
jgi:hypothetical protein